MSDIYEKVKDVVMDRLHVTADRVNPETSFVKDLGADSLDKVEVIMELEKRFDISLDTRVAETFDTPMQVTRHLESILKK